MFSSIFYENPNINIMQTLFSKIFINIKHLKKKKYYTFQCFKNAFKIYYININIGKKAERIFESNVFTGI